MKNISLRPTVEITTPKWLHSATSIPATRLEPSSVRPFNKTPTSATIPHIKPPYRTKLTLECVEIESPRKRKRPSSTQPSGSSSPRKRKKFAEGGKEGTLQSDTRSNSPSVSELLLYQSPTVSDIANAKSTITTHRSMRPLCPRQKTPCLGMMTLKNYLKTKISSYLEKTFRKEVSRTMKTFPCDF
ncbi:hypothetical protein PM082_013475 [Marasmius tenuissimus]|nr:hypothetical protein PM082_013475 [Marasmius tenuissimus]